MNEAMSPMPAVVTRTTSSSTSTQPRVALTRIPSGFPFPSASPFRPCSRRAPLYVRTTSTSTPITTATTTTTSRHSQCGCGGAAPSGTLSGRLPRIEHKSGIMRRSRPSALSYTSTSQPDYYSLPQLRRDPLRWSKIPRRIESFSSQNHEGLIRTPKMVKSAKSTYFRSSVPTPLNGIAHSTSVPTSFDQPESRRLCPLVPSSLTTSAKPQPTRFSYEDLSDDDDEPVLRSPKSYSAAAHCHLPCKPLIHSRQRSHAHSFIPRRIGTTQAPAWSALPSPLGIRQNILISYHTAPPDAREAAEASVKHRRPKKVFAKDSTHKVLPKVKPDAEVEEAAAAPTKNKDDSPQTTIATTVEPNLTPAEGSREGAPASPTEGRSDSPSARATTVEQGAPPCYHPGPPPAPLMPFDEEDTSEQQPEQQPQQPTQQQQQQPTPSEAAKQEGADGEAMKGTNHDSMAAPTVVVPAADPEQLPPAAESAQPADDDALGRSTCVSIVIDAVEEDKLPMPVVEEPMEHLDDEVEVTEDIDVTNPEIKLQSILDYVKIRRNEFAKLLEEHAEIVHEINKFEGGVTS